MCEEQEAELTEFPRVVDPSRLFEGAPAVNCAFLGELVTCRTDFISPGAVVSFDENFYLGKADLEIEIEGDRESIEEIAALLSPMEEYKKGNGKFSRFLNEYKKYHC